MTSVLDSVPPDPKVDRVYREFPYMDKSEPTPAPISDKVLLVLGLSSGPSAEIARELLAARGALRFYADPAGYEYRHEWHEGSCEGGCGDVPLCDDGGAKARALLPEKADVPPS